jgi:hypothetical protein
MLKLVQMDLQNQTAKNGQQINTLEYDNQELLNAQQQAFVDYLAIGGLVTVESNEKLQAQDIHQMTITEFCEAIGISRDTFYRWKKTIPNLVDRIRTRRHETFGLNRETALYNRAYLIAMTSRDHKAAGEMIKLLSGHFGQLELPVQRQIIKQEGESWAALVEKKKQAIIEGEIVNDPQVKEHDRPTNNS